MKPGIIRAKAVKIDVIFIVLNWLESLLKKCFQKSGKKIRHGAGLFLDRRTSRENPKSASARGISFRDET